MAALWIGGPQSKTSHHMQTYVVRLFVGMGEHLGGKYRVKHKCF